MNFILIVILLIILNKKGSDMSSPKDINEKFIENVLERKIVSELVELIEHMRIDREWSLKSIDILEKRITELANK